MQIAITDQMFVFLYKKAEEDEVTKIPKVKPNVELAKAPKPPKIKTVPVKTSEPPKLTPEQKEEKEVSQIAKRLLDKLVDERGTILAEYPGIAVKIAEELWGRNKTDRKFIIDDAKLDSIANAIKVISKEGFGDLKLFSYSADMQHLTYLLAFHPNEVIKIAEAEGSVLRAIVTTGLVLDNSNLRMHINFEKEPVLFSKKAIALVNSLGERSILDTLNIDETLMSNYAKAKSNSEEEQEALEKIREALKQIK